MKSEESVFKASSEDVTAESCGLKIVRACCGGNLTEGGDIQKTQGRPCPIL